METVQFIPSSQRRLVLLAAQTDTAPVLIYGASGTGKGSILKWIHKNSPRATRPFLEAKHDSNQSLESQLIAAQGGTLVIPEIGAWTLGEQMAILTFLNTRSIKHPESPSLRTLLNVRIMATTSQALEGRAQAGLFNSELLEKLNVFRLEMPPLTRRMDEFSDIALAILGEITRDIHKEHIKGISDEAWTALNGYDWPGNIRELRNVLKISVMTAKGDRIERTNLPDLSSRSVNFQATREQFERTYLMELLQEFNFEIDKTCEMTRIDKDALLKKIQKYGITIPTSSP